MADRKADAAGIVGFLMDALEVKQLDESDLEFLLCATEQATTAARSLSEIVSGMGCLISADQTQSGTKAGSLWGNDVPTLLWYIASQVDMIGQLTYIGSEAEWELRRRAEARDSAAEVRHD